MDEYGVPDLRQLMASRTQFCTTSQFQEPFSAHGNLTSQPNYQPILVPADGLVDNLHHHHHPHYSSIINGCEAVHPANNNAAATTSSAAALYGIDLEHGHGWNNNINVGMNNDGGNNMNCRWPRQETLTLLEIRSGLDSKFKETNQKGPLWDEVSRIMGEEHGYQRSGKKCKEKFENLYKYYKKTKEGKAGRQDGRHYRFFRQLEAIYGDQTSNQSSTYARLNPLLYHHSTPNDTINPNQEVVQDQKHISCESLSFSNNSTEFDWTSSSENNDDLSISAIDYFMKNQSMGSLKNEKQSCAGPVSKKSWKAKVEDFVNSQIGKVINTQEAWMEKMLKSIEHRDEERIAQEEEWRKQQAAKFDREVHEFWAKERAWVESRDAAIMEALGTFPRHGISNHDKNKDDKLQIANDTINRWTEHEVASLIELIRTSLELTIQDGGCFKEGLWEEIAAKMGGCLGYKRSVEECKEKWENVSVFPRMIAECNKKHKEDATANMYHGQLSCYEGQQEVSKRRPDGMGLQLMDDGLSPSSSNMDVTSSTFHMQFNGGENLWDRYGTVKLSKGKNQ